jgi:DNA-binding beta-propeller fold protein YncE
MQTVRHRSLLLRWSTLVLSCLFLGVAPPILAQPAWPLFESGPVRPIALSPDGARLFIANTPESHLEIYDVGAWGLLSPAGSVAVGLEPVSVIARTNDEVWVVNHMSDSVSIVDVAASSPRVVRTLLVGDEPRDLVFAGSPERAFITSAHRGQQRRHPSVSAIPGTGDPQLTTEGVGRADVWVFDAANPGAALGGLPIRVLTFFGDTPRALATDGTTVYVAAFHSGNQTMAIPEPAVPDGFATACGPGGVGQGVPGPMNNAVGVPAPETGVIVRFDGSDWRDANGCTWNAAVELSLPDHDVFSVNANTLAAGPTFDSVGTILFNMAINPVTGKLYVTNTESRNEVRFEGPGAHGGSTVQGHLSESRVSVLDPAVVSVDAQHLNQHIDYTQLHTDSGANHAAIDAQAAHSLATPLQIVVSSEASDQRVFVAAFGSSKIGAFMASELENPLFETDFDPTSASASYIDTGGGPAGLALDGSGERLYVLTRFDNSLSVFDVSSSTSNLLQTIRIPTAEPDSIIAGRPLLYDAKNTSANGEASCASCHIFGDFDSLGWNLGNPDDGVTSNPQQFPPFAPGTGPDFNPMKGPMTTQTLRGLSTHGGMHWRGDRTNGFFNPTPAPCVIATEGDCDEKLSFDNFIVAFEGLLGRETLISITDMTLFTDFALQLMTRPNPVARLDGTQTPAQASGDTLYHTLPADGGVTCNACHVLDPAQGFFGSGGFQTFDGEPQVFKVAHLRNAYQKIGMFGLTGATGPLGDQVRGFGFLHDGGVDTLFNFLDSGPFLVTPGQTSDLEQFMLAFPSDLAPVVGQQVSIGPGSPGSFPSADVNARITMLEARAGTPFTSAVLGGTATECEVTVKTHEAGIARGWSREPGGSYVPDDGGPSITEAALRAKADPAGDGLDLSYTCAPPGAGRRMGIDRDVDSVLDRVDNCPAWPNGPSLGTCTAGDAALLADRCTSNGDCGTAGVCSMAQEDIDTNAVGDACEVILLPEPNGRVPWVISLVLLVSLATGRASRCRAREAGQA